ncbi:MAG: T9SS type A sorting domain-containing protein [Saprospiraceae bacterium]|nr:T9SS type A sorting domain-containing protein [Saprospiraceae bacterium]MCF8252837.1 T9SS type A sorting domain-containing protein [Saprospiraceae bacterium]MCF8283279.1 T9SS type A sorting domain-containing protein [Bacteroidales bacterium]MCF8314392.1 T9SS type A sorting domain-containing protein [Saprospiraceae bacterium]MCF8443276.1 T9SS type A sorting domain-containing protein [Saprospiraceae bacterium]
MKQLMLSLRHQTLKSSLSAVFLLVFSHAFATTYTFNGTTNTDWGTASNWSPSFPPSPLTSGNDIVIAANCVANPWSQTISSGAAFTVNSGVIMDAPNGQFHLNGTLTINGTFKFAHESFNLNNGSMTTIVAGGTLEQYGGNSFLNFASGATLTNYGTFTKNQGVAGMGGTWNNQSGSSFNILSGQTLNIHSSDMSFNAGSTVTNNGTFQSNLARTVNGLYKGSNGTASFALTNNGTVAPGTSPGCLTFSSGYTNGTGTLEIEVAGSTTACTDYDRLTVTGTATLGGVLALNITHTPSSSVTLIIINASALSGTFSSVTGLTSGWSLNYNNPSGDVELTYTVLPVELVAFTARPISGAVHLVWQTASESNNSGFEIQCSTDGHDWNLIGFIEGNGTSTAVNNYAFVDKAPTANVNYYRLNQLDADGRNEFSRIVSVKMPERGGVTLYPNPATHRVILALGAPQSGTALVTLNDISGRTIEAQVIEIFEGQIFQMPIELDSLVAGIYFVQVQTPVGTWQEKLVVK